MMIVSFLPPVGSALSIGELVARILARCFGAQEAELVGCVDPDRERDQDENCEDEPAVHAGTEGLAEAPGRASASMRSPGDGGALE